jgi:hypothetical protein
MFITLALNNFQCFSQLAHVLPPLASALNTYAFALLRNVDSRRDYDNSCQLPWHHDTACGVLSGV